MPEFSTVDVWTEDGSALLLAPVLLILIINIFCRLNLSSDPDMNKNILSCFSTELIEPPSTQMRTRTVFPKVTTLQLLS